MKDKTIPTGCISRRVGERPDSRSQRECRPKAHSLQVSANMMDTRIVGECSIHHDVAQMTDQITDY